MRGKDDDDDDDSGEGGERERSGVASQIRIIYLFFLLFIHQTLLLARHTAGQEPIAPEPDTRMDEM